jgi:hypothetical protein
MNRSRFEKLFFPRDFRLKIIAFWLGLWAFFNGMNAFFILFHDIDIHYMDGMYYPTLGLVRILIMIVSAYIAVYLWIWDSRIIIYKWNEINIKKE